MKSSSFTPLRVLGVVVGSFFVVAATLTANDRGLTSFDGFGRVLGMLALGLVFIAYGVKGDALMAHSSPKLHALATLLINLLFVATGLRLLADPDHGLASKAVGGLLLLLGIGLSWVVYVARRSPPTA